MPKIKITKERCKGCFLCVTNCPNGLIKVSKDLNVKGTKYAEFFGGKCTGCALCAVICPECIIKVYR
jgi:2-oxoglutarate ferredoxin oxidoreductase subunit delta